MKPFLNAIHQHSEKRIDIQYKVTFGFKYIICLFKTMRIKHYGNIIVFTAEFVKDV